MGTSQGAASEIKKKLFTVVNVATTKKKRKGITHGVLKRQNKRMDGGIPAEMDEWVPLKNMWREGG